MEPSDLKSLLSLIGSPLFLPLNYSLGDALGGWVPVDTLTLKLGIF